ncbi:MAG: ribonuclease P component 1 family protein [Sulfolobales archaeon]
MKRRGSNLIYHELIGLEVRVISSTDPSVENLEGIVVDETSKTLKIYSSKDDKVRTVFKIGNVFKFRLTDTGEEIVVMGDLLLGRPGERAKRVVRR